MKSVDQTRYDPRTIALHWWVAAMVAFQWLGAHAIDWFPKGPLRVDARSVHILVGATLAVLLVVRIHWRLTQGRQLPPANTGALQVLAKSLHFALYGTIAAIVTLGLFTAWVRGDSLFGIASIPHFGSYAPDARHQLANTVAHWHAFAANLVLILAAGHILAAIAHTVIDRNGALLARMGLRISR